MLCSSCDTATMLRYTIECTFAGLCSLLVKTNTTELLTVSKVSPVSYSSTLIVHLTESEYVLLLSKKSF